MRDILFKAKRINNGEWVEGYLIQSPYMGEVRSWISTPEDKTRLRAIATYHGDWRAVEVGTDTLCQYTGLTDKNGQKIWENDIIQLEDRICHIYWLDKNAQFDCKFIKHNKDIVITNFKGVEPREYEDYEIIGNVFDNPELLKGGGAE